MKNNNFPKYYCPVCNKLYNGFKNTICWQCKSAKLETGKEDIPMEKLVDYCIVGIVMFLCIGFFVFCLLYF